MARLIMGASMVLALAFGLFVGSQRVSAQDLINCDQIATQQDAQAIYDYDTSDPNGLDGPPGPASSGTPGVACEGGVGGGSVTFESYLASIGQAPQTPTDVPTDPTTVTDQPTEVVVAPTNDAGTPVVGPVDNGSETGTGGDTAGTSSDTTSTSSTSSTSNGSSTSLPNTGAGSTSHGSSMGLLAVIVAALAVAVAAIVTRRRMA